MNFASTRIRAASNDDGMIPLINIVFLLLIFFMVAGTISASDAVMVTPPMSKAESPLNIEQMTVIIGHDNDIYLANEQITLEQLTSDLTQMQNQMLQNQMPQNQMPQNQMMGQSEDSQGISILIKADGQLSMHALQEVLAHVKSAGIARISLATFPVATSPVATSPVATSPVATSPVASGHADGGI
ncbi:MAG: hypothetical protein COA43_05405 [Robiginitomaculum sp.]|nr:MAG: hypothetical protein COA43_05405 [Robiginitomaculum sp.]